MILRSRARESSAARTFSSRPPGPRKGSGGLFSCRRGDPEEPEDPENPEDPEYPEYPENPEDPEDPEGPEDPECSEDPEDLRKVA